MTVYVDKLLFPSRVGSAGHFARERALAIKDTDFVFPSRPGSAGHFALEAVPVFRSRV